MLDSAIEPPPHPEIPDKLYFRIGEVARLAGIKPYVLRFWETEFQNLGPKKSGTGHRLYRRKDVEMVLEIKHLLYEKRYTIEGARKFLENRVRPLEVVKTAGKRQKAAKAAPKGEPQGSLFGEPSGAALDKIRQELIEIAAMLK